MSMHFRQRFAEFDQRHFVEQRNIVEAHKHQNINVVETHEFFDFGTGKEFLRFAVRFLFEDWKGSVDS